MLNRPLNLWHKLPDRRASAAVEFALISCFFLLPLFIGAADMIEIIVARAQLNTALQSLYSFAWSNPTLATSASQMQALLNLINNQGGPSLHRLSLPAKNNSGGTNPSITYDCIANNATKPGYASINTSSGKCTFNQTQQVVVSFQVDSMVILPIPVPFIKNDSMTLIASGSVQAQ